MKIIKLVYINKTLAYTGLITYNIYILQVKSLLTLNKIFNLIKLWYQQLTHIRYNNTLKLISISTKLKDINMILLKEICNSSMKDY